MSILKNLTSEGIEEQEDRLGGFSRKPTSVYEADIKTAYLVKSKHGAHGLNLIATINGQEYREPTIWFTNRNGENFYVDKETKKKKQLPGFNLVNNLCRLAIDKELHELDTEDKTVKVYDPDEKKELPKSVPCIVELHGAKVLFAIVEQTVDKTEDDGNGNYVPTGEGRDENVIEHVFHYDLRATVNELVAIAKAEQDGKTPPKIEFAEKWLERYDGKKRDKRTVKEGEGAPRSGRPSGSAPQATGGKPATSSLFNRGK
ncbi:ssDNA binding protein [Agrobacterium phage OLIVR2]|uniref:SsDNA binding protein n=1 Tax=Agrobacterium phage OLIVR1 TaxID=2723769 RepID=A0A858MR66_9CAUD|nr:hypothetical protein [Xanthomonas campestris]YP_010107113.1 single strand DNA binding protein [Agrobacterium phage OLIVR1]QIW87382.1 ssDNA binding protein [Agrobacterium phage OLIVR2]QIW87489.1 ssDNA binding protein [Agrobacterium phage OLIVR3]MCF8861659.1 hypothetical protein [Xanthomonas campestris pv. campestris]QIW87274.1 ssDNA binding protein [Agrobacterium phage OLIVR1]